MSTQANMIKGMSKEAKRYYINLMVKFNQLTIKEAVILSMKEGLI